MFKSNNSLVIDDKNFIISNIDYSKVHFYIKRKVFRKLHRNRRNTHTQSLHFYGHHVYSFELSVQTFSLMSFEDSVSKASVFFVK